MQTSYQDGFFNVSAEHGFLPAQEPLRVVPEEYPVLQEIMDHMPALKNKFGAPGLLSTNGAIETIVKMKLPNYLKETKEETDPARLASLYRAYTFLASAYLLSPAHHSQDSDGAYGRAHDTLPANIAQPLCQVADALQLYPFLDYHYAYSLGNYMRRDPNKGLHWSNLDMACSFTGECDEVGFIMNHVYINEVSPALVGGVIGAVNAAAEGKTAEIATHLKAVHETMVEINTRRATMWKASRYRHYNDFRTFIMGIQGNTTVFGDGVVYEGCDEEVDEVGKGKKRQYRGQTGAQDDIIPTMDIFSGVVKRYPDNMLTKYLLDLRSYRPPCVQRFFADLSQHVGALHHCVAADRDLSIIMLSIVEQIYYFRNGHWQFVQKYIMSNTRHPVATGGTPITSWIPNQIEAVLKTMGEISKSIGAVQPGDCSHYQQMLDKYGQRVTLLESQLAELKTQDYSVDRVFDLNKERDDIISFGGKDVSADSPKAVDETQEDPETTQAPTAGTCPFGH